MDLLGTALSEGLLPAIVVAVYLIIIRIIDNKRDEQQIKITNQLVDSINKISKFLDHVTDSIIDKDKDKCKVAIKNTFQASRMVITEYVTNVIAKNHIELNRESIIQNTKHLVNAEFYKTQNDLSMYVIDGIKVSDVIKHEWLEEVINDALELIYHPKLDKEQKIFSFVSRLSIRFDDYVVYINSKIFK